MSSMSHLKFRLLFPLIIALTQNLILSDESNNKDTRVLRILSYNIKHGYGMDDQVDLNRSAQLINRLKPDLVALQEIDKSMHLLSRVQG